MVWAADTDLIKGTIGEQSGNIVGNDVVQRMLELHRQLWVDRIGAQGKLLGRASRWGSDFRAGKIGISRPTTAWSCPPPTRPSHKKVASRLLSGPDGDAAFFDRGDNMCIPHGAKNASGAWEFVRFALDLPQQIDLPAGGYTPNFGSLVAGSVIAMIPA
jgi:multiple sugar transport system substrate-binding protein